MADHYAVLGLAPYAEHSAVRAAYLALMRRYHPDMNSSEEAAARAREVTAAYEVLGNPDRRIDYDLARAHAHAALADRKSSGLGARGALAALATVGGIAMLTLFFLTPSTSDDPVQQTAAVSAPPGPRQRTEGAPLRPSPSQTPPAEPADTVVAQAQAGVARAPANVEVAPPPAPVELKRAPPPVVVKRPPPPPAIAVPPPPRIEAQRPVAQKAKASADDAALAGLDRHLGLVFRQSVQRADAAKRQSLYRDHYRFIGRLNGCSTEACKKREYLARMGEVTKTMAAPAKPR